MSVPTAAIVSKAARAVLTLAGCLLLSLAVTSEASASVAVGSPGTVAQALKHSLSAATEAGSVRITVQFFSGPVTGKVVQDSSLDSGKQTVAIGQEVASVVVVGGAGYFSGNRKGLTSYFGVPTSLVSKVIGHWVSLQASDSAFHSVTANVTLKSALANVTPSGTLIAGKRSKVDRQWVKSIAGTAPGGGGRLTIFIAANGRSLPVKAVELSRTGSSARGEIVTFTRWGEQFHVATPSGSIPIALLRASSSASGRRPRAEESRS
jgi:hypothetical protein